MAYCIDLKMLVLEERTFASPLTAILETEVYSDSTSVKLTEKLTSGFLPSPREVGRVPAVLKAPRNEEASGSRPSNKSYHLISC